MTKQSDQNALAAQTAANTVATAAQAAATSVANAAAAANVVVNTDISYIKRDVSEIKQNLKEMVGAYINRAEFLEVVKVQEDHEKRTRVIEQNMWKWLGVASVLSAVGVALISYFVQKM